MTNKKDDAGFEKIDWGMIGIYALWFILAFLVLGYIPIH
jgi:hypothetical protein